VRTQRTRLRAAWAVALAAAVASRIANALLQPGPNGYDAWGHIAYVLFLDLYRSVPYADQGWSYFHPPLHYFLGWLLAQSGSAEVLVRGLSLIGSAASLGTALLAAGVVRRALPGRAFSPVLAFAAVAFLPLHIYTSPMSGNQQTATFLGSAAVAVFLANTARSRPLLVLDAATGALAGLALLTKFSGLLPLLAIAAVLALQLVRGALPARRTAARLAVVFGAALLISAAYYARNVAEFGTPLRLSRSYPLVASLESQHGPGERRWGDYLYLPPTLLSQPNWSGEHLWPSVWGTAYVRTWVEDAPGLAMRRALAAAGVIPTALALFGFALALGRARRNPGSATEVTMALLAAGVIAAFALFAWRVPIFSALKASYLLDLSLPYGFFFALAVADPPRLGARSIRAAGPIAVVVSGALALMAFTPGLARPLRAENALMATARAYFGEYEAARAVYAAEIRRAAERPPRARTRNAGWPVAMREALAAVELEAGNADRALALYLETARSPRWGSVHLASADAPRRLSDAAAAAALAGQPERARQLLDRALRSGPVAEPLVNRGALWALEGDLAGAETDLRRALELVPDLAAAHRNLAWVWERGGDPQRARHLRGRAERLAGTAPRGFPYGAGDGFHVNQPRFLLVIERGELALYRPARARNAPD
jgi:tetratricopeptide (TPR) repeat protein